MTLLTTIQDASAMLALPVPSFVVGNTDTRVVQMLAFANQEGRLLSRAMQWQQIVEQYTFSSTAGEEQIGAFPSDFQRFINGTWYDRTTIRPMYGPISPQDWQTLKALPAYASPYLNWRQRGGDMLVLPEPAAGDTIAYEYVSKNWVVAADDTKKDSYTRDDDTARLDEPLIAYGVVWRFLAATGQDYAEAMATYEREKERLSSADGSAPVLTLDGRGRFNLPVGVNLPIGSWTVP